MIVRINENIYNKMLFCSPVVPPETGGFIGIKDNVVTEFIFDLGITKSNMYTYEPNAELLSCTLEDWAKRGISFGGIAHTHFPTHETISNGDVAFIREIAKINPSIADGLLFPIIIPNEKIIVYKTCLISDRLIIKKVKYNIERM